MNELTGCQGLVFSGAGQLTFPKSRPFWTLGQISPFLFHVKEIHLFSLFPALAVCLAHLCWKEKQILTEHIAYLSTDK